MASAYHALLLCLCEWQRAAPSLSGCLALPWLGASTTVAGSGLAVDSPPHPPLSPPAPSALLAGTSGCCWSRLGGLHPSRRLWRGSAALLCCWLRLTWRHCWPAGAAGTGDDAEGWRAVVVGSIYLCLWVMVAFLSSFSLLLMPLCGWPGMNSPVGLPCRVHSAGTTHGLSSRPAGRRSSACLEAALRLGLSCRRAAAGSSRSRALASSLGGLACLCQPALPFPAVPLQEGAGSVRKWGLVFGLPLPGRHCCPEATAEAAEGAAGRASAWGGRSRRGAGFAHGSPSQQQAAAAAAGGGGSGQGSCGRWGAGWRAGASKASRG